MNIHKLTDDTMALLAAIENMPAGITLDFANLGAEHVADDPTADAEEVTPAKPGARFAYTVAAPRPRYSAVPESRAERFCHELADHGKF